MKYEKINVNTVKFDFTVTAEEFEHGLEYSYDQIKENVELKGFRKGKVPRSVFESKNGVESLYEEALNHVLGHKFNDALSVEEFVIVSQPENIDLDFANVKKGESFPVSFEVAIKPEVTLGEYKNLKVAKPNTDVTEEEVNDTIKQVLNQQKTLEVKESGNIEVGDTAIFDFDGYENGVAFEGGQAENYELEIGSNQFIPGFETQMIGMAANSEGEVNVTFPEDYHAEELKGKDVVFKVKIHEIKKSVVPELTDEFVKGLSLENVETVEQYQEKIKTDLTNQKEVEGKNETITNLLALLVENATMDIPKAMIDQEANNFKNRITQQAQQYNLDLKTFLMFSGMDEEQFEQQAQEQATKRVSESLAIEQVVKIEKITATKEEIASEYEKLAAQYQMPVEEIKKHINDTLVENDVTFQKAIDLIVENAILE